jgi:hypothetical protein
MKIRRRAADRCESPSICGKPHKVSKYYSCIFKQTKKKTKKEKMSDRGCSGIGSKKTKKMIFFQGLNLDECKKENKKENKKKNHQKNIKKPSKNYQKTIKKPSKKTMKKT